MESVLTAESAIGNIVSIKTRSLHLSLSLRDIAHGLRGFSVTPAVTSIAQEFAELSDLARQLADLLKNEKEKRIYTDELLQDAGKALSRLEYLTRYFEDAIAEFKGSRTPRRFRDIFKESNITDLSWYCRSVKEPLRMQAAALRIAYEQERLKRVKKKKQPRDTAVLARECEFAETWAEASREVINALVAAESRMNMLSRKEEKFESPYRFEPWGKTAKWMYTMIFAKTLEDPPGSHGARARPASPIKTVFTENGYADVSDGENEEKQADNISASQQRELNIPLRLSRDTVNEILQRWTSLDSVLIRQITDNVRSRDSNRVKDSVPEVIKWYNRLEEEMAHERETRPRRNSRGRSEERGRDPARGRRGESDGGLDRSLNGIVREKNGTGPEKRHLNHAPTPPTSPKIVEEQQLSQKIEEEEHTGNSGNSKSAPVAEASTMSKVSFTPRATSAETVELLRNAEPPISVQGKNKNTHTILRKGETLITDGDGRHASMSITFSNDANTSGSTSAKRVAESKIGMRSSSRPTVSRAEADALPPRLKKEEYYSSDGIVSRSKDRKRPRSVHDSTHRRSTLAPNYPVDESWANHTYHPQSSGQYPRQSFESSSTVQHPVTQAPGAFSSSRMATPFPPHTDFSSYTQHLQGRAGNGAYLLPAPPVHSSDHNTVFLEQTSSDNAGRIAAEVQQQLDQRENERKKTRDNGEDAKKEQDLKEAKEELRRIGKTRELEDRERQVQEEKQRYELEQLRETIAGLREQQRVGGDKWHEEKQQLESLLKDYEKSEQQARKTADEKAMEAVFRKEEMDRLHNIIANLQESKRDTTQDWEKQREILVRAAEEELRRKIEDREEEKKRAIEEVKNDYEEKLKAEQETSRKAKERAEHYVELYNGTIGRDRPAAASRNTQLPEGGEYDPFQYQYSEDADRDRQHVNRDRLYADRGLHGPEKPKRYGERHRFAERDRQTERNRHGGEQDRLTEFSNGTDVDTIDSDRSSDAAEHNPWAGSQSWQRDLPSGRTRPYTESADSHGTESSNIIVFPPRAGAAEFEPNRLGNYLLGAGFKAMFEERERNPRDKRRRIERIGSSGNILRGTLFWQPPASTAEAELYKSLRNSGWRPTYVRTTASGQTWFFGTQPVHAQFFSDVYKPQVRPFDISRSSHGAEKESLVISNDLVETDELDLLGHIYREQDGKIFLDPTLTAEDIDHIVARSFLSREGRYRKKFRNTHLRFQPPKQDAFEVASEAGESESSTSTLSTRDGRLSLWPFWGAWSSSG